MGVVSEEFMDELTADGSRGHELFWAAALRGINPGEVLGTDVWAERYAMIPKRTGAAEPGKFRLDRTPLARPVLQALSEGSPYNLVVLKAPSQMLKTQSFLNWLAEVIDQRPANILALTAGERMAKRLANRIDGVFEETPRLEGKVHKSRAREQKNTVTTKGFEGGELTIGTVNSSANLAEISARFYFGDELDRWPRDVEGEGNAIKLMKARTTTFGDRAQGLLASTPVEMGNSAIDDAYEEGTRSVVEVPCPHCQEYFEPTLDRLQYLPDFTRIWMDCPACGCELYEKDKLHFLKLFRVKHRNELPTRTFSLTFEASLGPPGWIGWEQLAREHAEALRKLKAGDHGDLQVFFNTRRALSYKIEGERLKWELLRDRARGETRPIRIVPMGAFVCVMAVDVQGDRLEYKIMAYGRGEEAWVVDVGVLYGDPVLPDVWTELTTVRQRRLQHAGGQLLRIEACVIDSSYLSHTVYQYVRDLERQKVFALKGVGEAFTPIIGRRVQVDVKMPGVPQGGEKAWLINVGTNTCKDLVAGRLAVETPGPGYIHLADWYTEDHCKQLCAEERKTVRVKGKDVSRWERLAGKPANEQWDLVNYCVVAAHLLGLHKWKAHDWDRVEAVVQPPTPDLFAPGAVPPQAPAEQQAVAIPIGGTIDKLQGGRFG